MLTADLTDLPASLRKKIHEVCTNEFLVQAQLAKIRQQKIAKFHADNEGRAIDGIGGQEMAIDPFWVGYFQRQHHTNYFEDHDFRDWLKRRFDWLRVKTGGTKIMVGAGGTSAGATRKRFSQRFNGPSGRAPGESKTNQPTPNVTTI